MKICAAQIQPFKGNIDKNIEAHIKWLKKAASYGVDLILFPELSLTAYEPTLAQKLVTTQEDKRLDIFQNLSDSKKIMIGLGLPTKSEAGIHISLVFFQAGQPRQTYSKQYLHADELPYFVEGQEQLILSLEHKKIIPAICYESLLPQHAAQAFASGAEIYMASVAKPAAGVEKAFKHYPGIAKKYGMTVLMANSLGYCDNFESAGRSAVWNDKGILVGELDDKNEGLLIFDTVTGELHNNE